MNRSGGEEEGQASRYTLSAMSALASE